MEQEIDFTIIEVTTKQYYLIEPPLREEHIPETMREWFTKGHAYHAWRDGCKLGGGDRPIGHKVLTVEEFSRRNRIPRHIVNMKREKIKEDSQINLFEVKNEQSS